jgi:hypothetical protein
MKIPAASRRGISEELILNYAASSGELTPKEIRKILKRIFLQFNLLKGEGVQFIFLYLIIFYGDTLILSNEQKQTYFKTDMINIKSILLVHPIVS